MQPINGVSKYTQYKLDIFMPEGQECCQLCPCMRKDYNTDTYRCLWNWNYLDNPKNERDADCPLIKYEVKI